MRHRKSFNHLSRKRGHRKAMLSNMAASLIMHKRIKTTTAKAKALRMFVEPLITRSKDDSTHSRRVAFSYLQNKEAVTELFREISPKIVDRPGGYTRILKTGTRLGDNAEMCVIELVDYNENLLAAKSEAVSRTTRRRRRGGKKKGFEPGQEDITTKPGTEGVPVPYETVEPVSDAAETTGEVKESPEAEADKPLEETPESKTEQVSEETQPESPAGETAEETQPEAKEEEEIKAIEETKEEEKQPEDKAEVKPSEQEKPDKTETAGEVAEEPHPDTDVTESREEKKETPANEADSEKGAEDDNGKNKKE
jgi:large subunit ribosomal protein L17